MVVHLVHKLGLVEESDEDDTDTTSVCRRQRGVPRRDTTAARVVTYPVENTLYVSFNGIANRSTEYFVAVAATA